MRAQRRAAPIKCSPFGDAENYRTVSERRGHLFDCTIFMAEVMSAETSVMLLGTIKVVVASLATRE